MTSGLANRLGDIPGIASVTVDLDGFGRGIDVRLEPGADEVVVMEKLRALLAAYGVRRDLSAQSDMPGPLHQSPDVGVDVRITPTDAGARIEVATASVQSFRIVAAKPRSIAQGLADAWCQVIGRLPIEVTDVSVDGSGRLVVSASDGEHEVEGTSEVAGGWVDALITAVARTIGDTGNRDVRKVAS